MKGVDRDPLPRLPRPVRRTVGRIVLAIAAMLLAALAIAHLAPVRVYVLAEVIEIARAHGLVLRASSLKYNVLTLSGALEDVSIAGVATPDEPFFRTERVSVGLGTQILLGEIRIREVALRSPALSIRERNGATNLPTFGESADEKGDLWIPTLDIEELDVRIERESHRYEARDVRLVVTSHEGGREATGRIEARNGLVIDLETLRQELTSVEADLTFDGAKLSIAQFRAIGAGAHLTGNGFVEIAGENPELDLRLEGTSDLATWKTAKTPEAVAGVLTLSGRVRGPLVDPAAEIHALGRDLTWARYTASEAELAGAWRSGTIEVERLRIRIAGGELHAAGSIDPDAASQLHTEWSKLDLRQLVAMQGERQPLPSTGTAEFRWTPATAGKPPQIHMRLDAEAGAEGAAVDVGIDAAPRGSLTDISVTASSEKAWNAKLTAELGMKADDWRNAPILGRMALNITDLRTALERIRAWGIPLDPVDASTVSGTASLDGTLHGTLGALQIDSQLKAPRLQVAPWPTADVDARFAANLGDATSSGTLRLRTTLWAVTQPGVQGDLIASASWTGPIAAPKGRIALRGPRLAFDDNAIGNASFDARFSEESIDIERLQLVQPQGGRLDASGRYTFASKELSLQGSGQNLTVRWVANDGGVAQVNDTSLRIDIDGTLDRPKGIASLTIGNADFRGQRVGPLHANLDLSDRTANLHVRESTFGLNIDGQIATREPYAFNGQGRVRRAPIAAMLTAAGVPADVSGQVDGDLSFRGAANDLLATSARVEASLSDASFEGVPIHIESPLLARLENTRLRLEETTAKVGDVAMRMSADFGLQGPDGGASLTLEGNLGSLQPLASAAQGHDPFTVDGRISSAMQLQRSAAGLTLQGDLSAPELAIIHKDAAILKDAKLRVDFTGSRAAIAEFRGTTNDGEAHATGSIPLSWANDWLPAGWKFITDSSNEPARLDARAALAWAPAPDDETREQIRSSANVDVTAHLVTLQPSLKALQGEVRIESGRIASRSEELVQAEPTIVRIADGEATLQQLRWQGTGNELTGHGRVALTPDGTHDLTLDLQADLSLLEAIASRGMTGRVSGRVALDGPATDPRLTANIALDDADWAIPESRLMLSDWSGRLRLGDRDLQVDQLTGNLNGGAVKIDGRIDLSSHTPKGRMSLDAQDVMLDYPRGLYSQTSTSLVWQPVDGVSTIAGNATITANRYTEPITRILELVDSLTTEDYSDESTLPEWFTATRLDVGVQTTDPVVIDNSAGDIELIPDLRLVGTIEAPALTGRIDTLDGGRIRLGGRSYELRASSLHFSPAEGLQPTLDVIGETKIDKYDVTLRISGTASRIETSYSSSPPLSERDLKSLIVTGSVESTRGGVEDSNQFALAAASNDILGFAGKFVGLDSVSIGTADLDLVSKNLDSAQHVTVSKSLGRTFTLILSDNLETGALTWVLDWKPWPNYQFRAASVEDTERSLEFRRTVLFGPGGRAPTATASRATIRQRKVSDVTFGGSPGFPVEELSRGLKLKSGSMFDVRRWTEDRSHLETFYRDRSYQRVRIMPTRKETSAGDGASHIALDYQIQRGPLTVLEFPADKLPKAGIEAMNNVWRSIPVAQILKDQFARTARQQLAERNYLQAKVDVEIVSDTPELAKAIVRIDRGPQTSKLRLNWEGNQTISSADLNTLAETQTGPTSIWVDPDSVLRIVRGRYARLGYLDTRVKVGKPAFDGSSAVLPIEVVEGPRTLVSRVDITGADPTRRDAALAALNLPAGAPFGSVAVNEGRQRLKRYYMRLGYRDATVDIKTTHDKPNSRVALNVVVNESAQQVIEDVRIVGAETTSSKLVTQAVTLKAGDIAGQDALEKTRQNLYDIGSFRQVSVDFEPSSVDHAGNKQSVLAWVRTEEPRRYQFRYGLEVSTGAEIAGVSDDTLSYGVSADLTDRNFLGRAMEASLGGQWTPDLGALSALFSAPRSFGWPIRTSIYLSGRDESAHSNGITVDHLQHDLSIEQRWQWKPNIELTWAYDYNYDDVHLADGTIDVSTSGNLAGPSIAAIIDHRDSAFDATRGWYSSLSLQLGTEWLGSDLGYYRFLWRQSQLFSWGPVTFAAGTRFGTVHGYSGTAPLSAIDLFFTAGGTNSVRGYSEGSLSAVSVGELELGGTQLVVLNTEARFPIWGPISGVAFVDAGNTFARFEDIAFNDLAVGAGIGLRIRTPLAPLRLDFGYPLTTGFGDEKVHVHFSVGQMF